MPNDLLQLVLFLAAWIVAFLLGKELETGFSQWRQSRQQVRK